MKTIKNWKLVEMSSNDTRSRRFYNLPYLLVYNGRDTVAPCGSTDNVSLFQEGDDLILLCSNSRHGYVGITVYDFELNEKTEYFCQNMEDELLPILDISMDRFFDYTYLHQAEIIYNLL